MQGRRAYALCQRWGLLPATPPSDPDKESNSLSDP
jgi:hypothetical protein